MNAKSYARWLVVAGAALAIIGFLLPIIKVNTSASAFGFEVEGISKSIALADLAKGKSLVYLIPLCFLATLVLNFIIHLNAIPQDQKKVIYIVEWVTLIIGLLVVVYVAYQASQSDSGFSKTVTGILGLFGVEVDFAISPEIGIIILVIGVGLAAYGLQVDSPAKMGYAPAGGYQRPAYYPSSAGEFAPPANDAPYQQPGGYAAPVQRATVRDVPAVHPARESRRRLISAWLVARDGNNYQLNAGETTIGRSSSNDIQLENSRVSKRHAKIVTDGGAFRLYDLGSTNGTWVNGEQARKPVMLHSDDKIRFGDSYTVQFVSTKPRT